jgi:hypothetical protein
LQQHGIGAVRILRRRAPGAQRPGILGRCCPEQLKDPGGCRCQAYLLTGDAANADPVCDKSPLDGVVTEAIEKAQRPDAAQPAGHPRLFRDPKEPRRLSQPDVDRSILR